MLVGAARVWVAWRRKPPSSWFKKQSEADQKSHTGVMTKPNSRWSEKPGTTRANNSSVLHSVAAAAAVAWFAVLSFGLAGDGFFFFRWVLKSRVVTRRKKEHILTLQPSRSHSSFTRLRRLSRHLKAQKMFDVLHSIQKNRQTDKRIKTDQN